ncbi:hypothetical protein M0R45_019595 [Rubus argutus]|uniref:Uncharacterized protein n=1 Tax=Rubus argutus TaxID=59490 RepID=A0AAW1X9H9_RUBAR
MAVPRHQIPDQPAQPNHHREKPSPPRREQSSRLQQSSPCQFLQFQFSVPAKHGLFHRKEKIERRHRKKMKSCKPRRKSMKLEEEKKAQPASLCRPQALAAASPSPCLRCRRPIVPIADLFCQSASLLLLRRRLHFDAICPCSTDQLDATAIQKPSHQQPVHP